ncbi:MAG: DUF4281 domain-containing protein [Alphaproteobacteria bacterium]|nr:DUF4281 domain-containing protein [Alphaproteobacteria bacterium]
MNYETAYSLINIGVLPAWLLLVFAPKAKITNRLVHSGLYPLGYGLLYAMLLGRSMFFGVGAEDGGMSTAQQVSAFFSHPNGVLIGWVHYLVFDLFIGAWIARDGARLGLAHWKLLPCLVFSFIFGPVGLLLYFLLRKFSSEEGLAVTQD